MTEQIGGREVLIFAPTSLPAPGRRALVVVLHGGLGNARRIESNGSESALRMDPVAEVGGFLVVYLNGTQAANLLGADMLGWNAGGGCCGLPARDNVDDEGYVRTAVDQLVSQYSIDRKQIYVLGHSNGAMMAQRLMCTTNLFAAAVAVSGPLTLDTTRCESSEGKRILAIHGANDENVPINGGRGAKGVSGVAFRSEERSREIFTGSGATYELEILPDVAHNAVAIDAAVRKTQGISLAQKAARFFGLIK
ncbi:MAG: prolyl oligopeptidase family serine peptidase [Burkholderiaceae bacterium]